MPNACPAPAPKVSVIKPWILASPSGENAFWIAPAAFCTTPTNPSKIATPLSPNVFWTIPRILSRLSPNRLTSAIIVLMARMTGAVEPSIPRNTLPIARNGEAAPLAMPPAFKPPLPNTEPRPAPATFKRLPELLISCNIAAFAFVGMFFTFCAHPKTGSDWISPGFARKSLILPIIDSPNPLTFPNSFAPPPTAFLPPTEKSPAMPCIPCSIFGAAAIPAQTEAIAPSVPAACGPLLDRYPNNCSAFDMILSMPFSAVSIMLSSFGVMSNMKSFA